MALQSYLPPLCESYPIDQSRCQKVCFAADRVSRASSLSGRTRERSHAAKPQGIGKHSAASVTLVMLASEAMEEPLASWSLHYGST